MSPREYFAGLAMQSLITHPYFDDNHSEGKYEEIAHAAVHFADALRKVLHETDPIERQGILATTEAVAKLRNRNG